MAPSPPDVPTVHMILDLVDRINLAHPASALLRAYIDEAVQPQAAADYVQRRLSADGHAEALVADWIHVIDSVISGTQPRGPSPNEINAITKRDGKVCCVTGKPGTLWDPLIVAPILPVPSAWLKGEPRIIELLEAFFGPQYFDWWRFFIDRAKIYSPYRTHWLVRKSVHAALQRGKIELRRSPSSLIEFRVEQAPIDDEQPVDVDGVFALLGDHSRQGIEKADARLIGSHARFCKSIQLVDVARTIAPGLFSEPRTITDSPRQQFPVRSRSSSLGLGHAFLRPIILLWRFFPSTVRFAAYELLQRMGNSFYGKDGNARVQRLPFGLYLKYNSDSDLLRNEYNALKVLEQKTSIPAPRALDIVSRGTGDNASNYLLMSRVPGTTLAKCRDALSDQDYATISSQLKDWVSQMRDIPKPVNHSMAICNTLGEACRDPRIRDWAPIGPFPDEASFSQHLRFSDEPSRRRHKTVFTHGDLNPRNIIVVRVRNSTRAGGWRLSGIIDWEAAGYYPDYRDCTKSMFERFRWPRRHNEMMRGVFSEFGDYSAELDVERRAWESGDGV
ncbi:ubiquitin interaction domain-containing protein [Fusarium austroafricanum]|uniref:Ubiquitin interaction domain-containing protein n=1 Tax=Fusarium austroafricanum TaxID=2364996 RepID=A0A8H4NW67_9HYPO|nr:ubiquitin interaction domain-containing protein [Fusarium austroafricanum]